MPRGVVVDDPRPEPDEERVDDGVERVCPGLLWLRALPGAFAELPRPDAGWPDVDVPALGAELVVVVEPRPLAAACRGEGATLCAAKGARPP